MLSDITCVDCRKTAGRGKKRHTKPDICRNQTKETDMNGVWNNSRWRNSLFCVEKMLLLTGHMTKEEDGDLCSPPDQMYSCLNPPLIRRKRSLPWARGYCCTVMHTVSPQAVTEMRKPRINKYSCCILKCTCCCNMLISISNAAKYVRYSCTLVVLPVEEGLAGS